MRYHPTYGSRRGGVRSGWCCERTSHRILGKFNILDQLVGNQTSRAWEIREGALMALEVMFSVLGMIFELTPLEIFQFSWEPCPIVRERYNLQHRTQRRPAMKNLSEHGETGFPKLILFRRESGRRRWHPSKCWEQWHTLSGKHCPRTLKLVNFIDRCVGKYTHTVRCTQCVEGDRTCEFENPEIKPSSGSRDTLSLQHRRSRTSLTLKQT